MKSHRYDRFYGAWLLLIATFLAPVTAQTLYAQQHSNLEKPPIYSKISIPIQNEDDLHRISELGLPLDCGVRIERGKYVVGDYSAVELSSLKAAGFEYTVLIEDLQKAYEEELHNEKKKTTPKMP